MSDEFLFDSEREQIRARKKRRLILLLALAGVVVLAAVVALILLSRRPALHSGGEDTPYPYTWQTLSDGSVRLQLSNEDAPEYRWVAAIGQEDPAVSVRSSEKQKNGSTITLAPVHEGRCSVTLTLQTEEEDPQVRYQQTLLLEAAEVKNGLSAAVLNSSGILLQTDAKGGGGTENPYRAYYESNGDLVVSVVCGPGERDWSCELLSGQDAISFLGLSYSPEEVRAYFRAGTQEGDSELQLHSEAAAVTLRLQCSTGADGTLQLTGHTADYGEKPAVPEYFSSLEETFFPAAQSDDAAP